VLFRSILPSNADAIRFFCKNANETADEFICGGVMREIFTHRA
jgi:hypothetical protein